MINKNILQLLKPKATISYIYEDCTLRQAVEKMKHHGYTAVPVINKNGGYVKTISEGDFLWFMLSHGISDVTEMENYSVRDIPRRVVCEPVYVYSTIEDLLLLSMNQNFVPVIDDRDVFIGIVTRSDIIHVCWRAMKDNGDFEVPEYARDESE
jgi:CBS domain-containing protein